MNKELFAIGGVKFDVTHAILGAVVLLYLVK